MPGITHQKARVLIEVVADQLSLQAEEKSALDAHLTTCNECNDFAQELSSFETNLREGLHARLDKHQPDIHLNTILTPSKAKSLWHKLLNPSGLMGKATVVAALLLGYFVITNLFGIQTPISTNETATKLPTPSEYSSISATSPTPSAPTTLAGSTKQGCETIMYLVQANDTLESIAHQHGITEEAILEHNDILSSDAIFNGVDLVIPVCQSTPSHTATISDNGITITPTYGTIFPTQPQ